MERRSRPARRASNPTTPTMTKSLNDYAGLTPYEVANVRHRARSLALKPGLGCLAVEDIEQELFAHILEKRSAFDPDRASWPTFVDRILLTKTLDILASMRAAKRRSGPPTPIDAVELVDPLTLDQKAADIRIQRAQAVIKRMRQQQRRLSDANQRLEQKVASRVRTAEQLEEQSLENDL